MKYATIQISGNQATVSDCKPITAGTVGGAVALAFDESWDGFQNTLVWRGSGRTVDDIHCTGVIPHEVLAKPNTRLYVGVYGTKDGTATPTVWADLGLILPGADPSGDESTDPTLPVWAQIPAYVDKELQKAKDSGAFKGDPGETGLMGPQGEKGEPGDATMDDSSVSSGFVWSSKHTVDRLCPAFTESGSVVACEPVEGYPLTVETEDGATKVFRSGKNMFNIGNVLGSFNNGDGTLTIRNRAAVGSEPNTLRDYAPGLRAGETYTLSAKFTHSGDYIYLQGYNRSWRFGNTMTVTEEMLDSVVLWYNSVDTSGQDTTLNVISHIQIERGAVATAYAPYYSEEFASGEPVPALAGENVVWADSGEVTVTGKADPTAVIGKLTNAIICLGGNV